jgi:hypothetical protein
MSFPTAWGPTKQRSDVSESSYRFTSFQRKRESCNGGSLPDSRFRGNDEKDRVGSDRSDCRLRDDSRYKPRAYGLRVKNPVAVLRQRGAISISLVIEIFQALGLIDALIDQVARHHSSCFLGRKRNEAILTFVILAKRRGDDLNGLQGTHTLRSRIRKCASPKLANGPGACRTKCLSQCNMPASGSPAPGTAAAGSRSWSGAHWLPSEKLLHW